MSFRDYVKIRNRVEENVDNILDNGGKETDVAKDVTFEEFMTVMKYVSDPRDFYYILEAHPEYVNQKDAEGNTALIIAAKRGMGDVVYTLINYNDADVFIKDKNGKTAAQYYKQYFEENPQDMEELGEAGKKVYLRKFEKGARAIAKASEGLDVVSRHKQLGKLEKLPPDVISRIGQTLTGVPGTIEQQRRTIRAAVGKGRKRKGKKSRRRI